MFTKKYHHSFILLISAVLISLLSQCSASVDAAQSPEQVVESFYRWYLGYPGNPMVDRAYRDQEALAESLVQEVDALLASDDGGHFDPFLLAQDIPVRFEVKEGVVSDETATVTVQQWWGGNDTPREIMVELALVDKQWQITKISDPAWQQSEPEAATPVVVSPPQVVDAFYGWYLAYIGERGTEQMRNPLSDGAYRDSQYLTAGLVQQVDELIASFDKGGYDPFLCAQDIPERIEAVESEIEGDRALVSMNSSFEGHTWTVVLEQTDGNWQIADINCGGSSASQPVTMSPEEVVQHFYNWYLAYIGERGSDEMRNPLSDGAYRDNDLLTADLVATIDAIPAEHGYFPSDPFLCAQDIPQTIAVNEVGVEGDQASLVVSTDFAGHSFTVLLVSVDGQWRMNAVLCQAASQDEQEPTAEPVIPAGWQVLEDEQYGFQLAFPADWTTQEVELRYPELDAPVTRIVHLMPLSMAEQVKPDGPPDPTQPAVVAPLGVQVIVGTLQAYHDRYGEPAASEQLEINRMLVIKESDSPGDYQLNRYLFQSPRNPEIWVMLVDQISGFPDRAENNQAVMETLDQIIGTLSFTQ